MNLKTQREPHHSELVLLPYQARSQKLLLGGFFWTKCGPFWQNSGPFLQNSGPFLHIFNKIVAF